MTPISVVIITFNEEKNIRRCLESVQTIADDIVVVDSFSTDRTKAISEHYGARIIERSFEGHIGQKNFAITQAKYPHVLSLDADECLAPELRESIAAVKNDWKKDGYYLNRLSSFSGKWIRHGSWYPDRKLRLWDSRKGKWGGINPHDKFEMITGSTTGYLKGDLLHFTAESEEEYLKKMDRYTDIASQALFEQGKTTSIPALYTKTAFTFIRNYMLRLGFLDGKAGYELGRISARYTYQKYRKLLQLNKIDQP